MPPTKSAQRDVWGALLLVAGLGLLGLGLYRLVVQAQDHPFTRIKVEKDRTDDKGIRHPVTRKDQDFIRSERAFILTDTILGPVAEKLKLEREWGEQPGGDTSGDRSRTLARLRQHLELRILEGTGLINISVSDVSPDLATTIPNTIAETYQEYRQAQQQRYISKLLADQEERWNELALQITRTRRERDHLSSELGMRGDLPARPDEDPVRVKQYQDLQQQLTELERTRQDLENEIATRHVNSSSPEFTVVEIVRLAVAKKPVPESERFADAGLILAGTIFSAGGGLWLKRAGLSGVPAPAIRRMPNRSSG